MIRLNLTGKEIEAVIKRPMKIFLIQFQQVSKIVLPQNHLMQEESIPDFPENSSTDEVQITEATDEQLMALKAELEEELQDDPNNPDPEVQYQIDRLIALKRSWQHISITRKQAFLIPKKLGLGTRICEINKSHPFYTSLISLIFLPMGMEMLLILLLLTRLKMP